MHSRVHLASVGLTCWLWAHTALSEPAFPSEATHASCNKETAGKHFDAATELTRQGRLREAIGAYEAAYSCRPHFAVLYNLSQLHAQSGELAHARQYLERYLEEGAGQIEAHQLASAREQLRQLVVVLQANALNTPGLRPPHTPSQGAAVESASAPQPAPAPKVSATAPSAAVNAPSGEPIPHAFGAVTLQPKVDAEGFGVAGSQTPGSGGSEPSSGARLSFALGGVALGALGAAVGVGLWNGGRHDRWRKIDSELLAARQQSWDANQVQRLNQRQEENNRLLRSIDGTNTVVLALVSGAVMASIAAAHLALEETEPPSLQARADGAVLGWTW